MNHHSVTTFAAFHVLLGWLLPIAHAQMPAKALPVPTVPGKALPQPGGPIRVVRSFSARGIETVVLRAEDAEQATVKPTPGQEVTVSGAPEGGAPGYHPPFPNWRETPPEQAGLDFEARVYGRTLVISTKAETLFIHHYYHLSDLEVVVPEGVEVVKERRQLSGDPSPELSPPRASRP